jgi:hypothetical protein
VKEKLYVKPEPLMHVNKQVKYVYKLLSISINSPTINSCINKNQNHLSQDNKRSHAAQGLADVLIKKYATRKISRLEFVSKLVTNTKMNNMRYT